MNIDATLKELASKGQLHSLTLFQTSNGSYQAAITHDRKAWAVGIDPDPVVAIKKCLEQRVPKPEPETDIFG